MSTLEATVNAVAAAVILLFAQFGFHHGLDYATERSSWVSDLEKDFRVIKGPDYPARECFIPLPRNHREKGVTTAWTPTIDTSGTTDTSLSLFGPDIEKTQS